MTKDKSTKVKVYVSGENLAEVASGFSQTRKALADLAEAVKAQVRPRSGEPDQRPAPIQAE